MVKGQRMERSMLKKCVCNSLIDIVALPVNVRVVVPLANGNHRGVCDAAFIEAGNQVGAANDVLRVNEPKSTILEVRNKLDPMQPLGFPPCPMCTVDLEPANPEYVHAGSCSHSRMEDLGTIDPQDPCVCVRMGWIIARKGDHIWTPLHVDLVASSAEIVRCVVYRHRVTLFETLAQYLDAIAIAIRERGGFWVVLAMQDAGKEVVFEIWNKSLVYG